MNDEEVEAFLEHHGVKGQKWGIRHDPLASIKNEYLKIVSKGQPALSKKEQAQNLAENKKKFAAKFEASDSKKESKPGFHVTKKEVIAAGLGAAFVGVVLATQTQAGRDFLKNKVVGLPKPESLVSPKEFEKAVTVSQATTWISGTGSLMLKPLSFEQGEMSFPAGHTFHRLSTVAETGFFDTTYSIPNEKCYNRYVIGFAKEKMMSVEQIKHITFQAKTEVRVPSLTHALEVMRSTVTKQNYGLETSKEEALAEFSRRLGGSWDDPTSRSFFEALKKEGYHAIIDHMDAGVIGDSPLVIFNKAAFTEKVAKEITPTELKYISEHLLELSHRKL